MVRIVLITVILGLASAGSLWADVTQTDWSGGGGITGPVTAWEDQFDTAAGVSWLSVPGQLALSSQPLAAPIEHLLSDAYTGTIGVAVGDIDDDGDTDVVGTADVSGVVRLWRNQGGDPLTWSEEVVADPPGAAGVDLADLDGDGRLDIVIALIAPRNKIVWRQNLGGDPIVWGTYTVEANWGNTWEMETGDVNGDGHIDVMATKWSPGEIAWWQNSGGNPIVWTKHTIDYPGGAHSVRGADLDQDGDMDLATAAGLANRIQVYWSDGANPPAWTPQVLDSTATGARSVWIDDVDGDGDLDIAGIWWDNHIAWWSNDGGSPAAWTRQIISDTAYGGHGVCIADVNGDGRRDILAACNNVDKIAWYENGGGSPITWTEHLISGQYDGAITVRAADLDKDGDLDPVSACYSAGEFTWWEVTGFDTSGVVTGSVLDSGTGAGLGSLDWTSVEPAGTGLKFQVRSSADPGNLGSWSPDITTPGCLPALLDRYVQYRAYLATSDAGASPILQDLTLSSCPAGVGTAATKSQALSLSAQPNPFCSQANIYLRLRSGQRISVGIFDVNGRRVCELFRGWLPAGGHRVGWNGLDELGKPASPGIYWVCAETADLREARQVVLIR